MIALFTRGEANTPSNYYARQIVQHILEMICTLPVHEAKIVGRHALEKKRFDRYVKKFQAEWSFNFYSVDKKKRVSKDDVIQNLKASYKIAPGEGPSFEKLVLGEKKNGLVKEAADLLFAKKSLFDQLMSKAYVMETIEALNEQTLSDINTNIISKLKPEVTNQDFNMVKIVDRFKSLFTKDRTCKKPFSHSDNLMAGIEFLKNLSLKAKSHPMKQDHIRRLIQVLEDKLGGPRNQELAFVIQK